MAINDKYTAYNPVNIEVQLQSIRYALVTAKREGRKYLECLLKNPESTASSITDLDKKRLTAYFSILKLAPQDITLDNYEQIHEKIRWTLWSPVFEPEQGYERNGYTPEGYGKPCNKCLEHLPRGNYVFPNGTSISLIDLHTTGCREKPIRPKPDELVSLLNTYWTSAGK